METVPHVLLVAATTGYQTRVFADAARRLGFELTLATDRCHVLEDPWGDHAIPIRFEDPEGARDILQAAGPFDGITAVADRPALIAASAAEALGIPFHKRDAVQACRDKHLARQRFEAAGLLVPEFFRIAVDSAPENAARQAHFPCVLKPLGLSGSRGVIRADDERQFAAAFERIKALLRAADIAALHEDQSQYIQVERFIEGREFAVEGIATRGELQVLAIFDKPDPLNGPFFEETIYVTPSRETAEVQDLIIQTTRRAMQALGLTQGPIHAELRVNQKGAWMLEVAARPIGGLCARALRFDAGMPLEELILRHAVGEDVTHARPGDAASGVMMIPIPKAGIYQGVEGVENAAAVTGIEDVIITAKEGQTILPLPEGSSYLGFLFARGERAEQVESALRKAHAHLHFEIATLLPVISR